MLEHSESKTVSELMHLARTVAVLDRGAMEALLAKQEVAISAGLADESLRYHLLDIVLQRTLSEYQPESRKEGTCQPCRLLDEVAVSEHLFLRSTEEFAGAIAVPVCEDVELNCYYHCPHQDALTLVHFHGGDESVAGLLQSEFQHRLQQVVGNVNLLLVEYRGFSGSSGHPRLVRMLRDGEMVLNALGIYPSRCIVYGRAIGSVYALELAFRQTAILGLVLEEPICDLAEFLHAIQAVDADT